MADVYLIVYFSLVAILYVGLAIFLTAEAFKMIKNKDLQKEIKDLKEENQHLREELRIQKLASEALFAVLGEYKNGDTQSIDSDKNDGLDA